MNNSFNNNKMNKNNNRRKELVCRIYKCPPIEIICPPKIFTHTKKSASVLKEELLTSQEKVLQIEDKKIATKSQWTTEFKSSELETQKQGTLIKRSEFSVKKKVSAEVKRPIRNYSPYVKNKKDFQKIMDLLKPVKGPTQSLLGQIRKHNDQNRKNAENVILNRNESFKVKMSKYSSRIGLNENSKIFVMNSKDTHIREILIENGWVETLNPETTFFHLKWFYTDSPSDYSKLQPGQFYNHFLNNQELTNKNLLRKNIGKAKIKPNFPPTFDLQLSQDLLLFKKELQKFQYIRTLSQIIVFIKTQLSYDYTRIMKNRNYFRHIKHTKCKKKSNETLLYMSSNGCEKLNLHDTFYNFCSYFCHTFPQLKDIEYEIFGRYTQKGYDVLSNIRDYLGKGDVLMDFFKKKDRFIMVEIVKLYQKLYHSWDKSFGSENAWIIKPAAVSRGSGITIENEPNKIFINKYGKIVQKYIEKPLILDCGRKFDIRQWVLVRSFVPFEAYIFEKCYCRFSSEKYSNDQYSNTKKHLTNYSKQKQIFSKTFSNWNSILSEEGLAEKIGDHWPNVKRQIKLNILKTLKACKNEIVSRPECFEVYGFDIMLDEQLRPWIIEVNLSPACQKRADFIIQYLRDMSEGIVDLLEERKIRHWEPLVQDQEFVQILQTEVNETKRVKIQNIKRLIAATKIQKAWRNSGKEKAGAITSELLEENQLVNVEIPNIENEQI